MRSIKDIFRSYAVLDEQGRHTNGTDKESNHHYGDAYEYILSVKEDVDLSKIPTQPHIKIAGQFRSIRQNVKLMMEVGIADGSSLLSWREVFPNALCVGMDIHHSDRAHGERIEFHLGDQRIQADCERAAGGRLFDFIVEDATHELTNNLLTFFWLWPFVRPGGLYVIEEFANVHSLYKNIQHAWPHCEIVQTIGPNGGNEPLVVFRKPK